MADMTLAEAGRRAGLSPSTLRNQVHAGRLKARLVGKTWTISERELARYLAESAGRPGRKAKAEAGRRAIAYVVDALDGFGSD